MKRLYKELESYSHKDYYPFHMPGHKRNPFSVDGEFPFDRDITEINGFDNLHHPMGILREAQEEAARIYGACKSFYSVNGSTAAILSAVSAAVSKGGEILMARNCHKSVYHALYLRDLQPTYIYPHADHKLGINGGISPRHVERCLEENPNIEAVLITSPTYDGIVSNVKEIAEIAHSHGVPLIVDEAHGAHFCFSDYFPVSAVDMGADVVIQSLHKTLPAMTQTALLHLCSDRVESGKIRRFMGVYQTSSPSYVLMASIDACMDKLAREGRQMFKEFTGNLDTTRERLQKCRHIRLLDADMMGGTEIYDYDRSKLLFSTVGSSINGSQLHTILREEFHLEMEMEAEYYVLGMATVGDTQEGLERLCNAIEEIDRREAEKASAETWKEAGEPNIPQDSGEYRDAKGAEDSRESKEKTGEGHPYIRMKQMMRIPQALEAPERRYPLEESVGRISSEFAYLYPPGIPILVPGEQITGLFVRNVRRYMEQGLELQGLSDSTNETICVVKE
ncbi:aminotransferase class I/II-fold pyridoxal phosphate-dependent enzyme [Blautia schinkii]|nr:aminotransferase class I/II-fold pyridoxal phosphate-dependent enzyme [Blautia schinkii]